MQQFSNARETVVIAHPVFLKIRLFASKSNSLWPLMQGSCAICQRFTSSRYPEFLPAKA